MTDELKGKTESILKGKLCIPREILVSKILRDHDNKINLAFYGLFNIHYMFCDWDKKHEKKYGAIKLNQTELAEFIGCSRSLISMHQKLGIAYGVYEVKNDDIFISKQILNFMTGDNALVQNIEQDVQNIEHDVQNIEQRSSEYSTTVQNIEHDVQPALHVVQNIEHVFSQNDNLPTTKETKETLKKPKETETAKSEGVNPNHQQQLQKQTATTQIGNVYNAQNQVKKIAHPKPLESRKLQYGKVPRNVESAAYRANGLLKAKNAPELTSLDLLKLWEGINRLFDYKCITDTQLCADYLISALDTTAKNCTSSPKEYCQKIIISEVDTYRVRYDPNEDTFKSPVSLQTIN